MNIENISQVFAAKTSPSATNRTQTGSSDQRDLFMTLLVAQLKNQDPLAPQDVAQFVAQLAQFNSLDQLTGIRQSIEQLIALTQHNNGDGGNSSSIAAQTTKKIGE